MTYTPAKLALADSLDSDPDVFGVILFLPHGGKAKSTGERMGKEEYIDPNNAKQYAVKIVDSLLKDGDNDNVRDTNWASVVAGIQKFMIDWNRAKRDRQGIVGAA